MSEKQPTKSSGKKTDKKKKEGSLLKTVKNAVRGKAANAKSTMIKEELSVAAATGNIDLMVQEKPVDRSACLIMPTAEKKVTETVTKEPPSIKPEQILKRPVMATPRIVRRVLKAKKKANPIFPGKIKIIRPHRFGLV